MSKRLLPMFLFAMFALAGCPSVPVMISPLPTPTSVEGELLPFETIIRGDLSGYPGSEAGLLLVTNLDNAQAVIEYLGPTHQQQEFIEHVHQLRYPQNVILALFREGHAGGGYEVNIDRVIRQGNELFVYAGLCDPAGRGGIAAATSYYQIVRVNWSSGAEGDIQPVLLAYPAPC